MNARVAEFDHFVALGADDVVVLTVAVAFFVLRQVAAELVPAYQAVLDQQIQRIIDGGPAYLQALLLHAGVELLDIEVAGTGVYFLQNGVALRRFAQAFIFEVGGENLLHLLVLFLIEMLR